MKSNPLLTEQLETLIQQGRLKLIVDQNISTFVTANLVSPLLITSILWITGELPQGLIPWIGFGLLLCTARALHHHEFKHFESYSKSARQWEFELILLSMLSGFLWAASAILFLDPQNPGLSIFIIAAIFAHISSAVASHAAHIRIFIAFALSSWLPACAFFFIMGSGFYYQIAMLGSFFVLANISFALNHNRSITQSLRLQYENASLLSELKQQKAIAVEANRAKSRFMAAASHDLRQPLHAMNLFADSLAERTAEPGNKHVVSLLQSSMNTLRELFDDLLDLSRLDAGAIKPQPKTFNLGTMTNRLLDEYGLNAKKKGLKLRSRTTDYWIQSDPALVEQILRNLIWNAIKYTHEGSVLVALRKRKRKVVFEVWDTGPGISEQDQNKIFDEFHQTSNPDRDRSQGIGLGLSIVHRTARLLQLELGMKSTLNKGSKFFISFKTLEQPAHLLHSTKSSNKHLDIDLNGVSVLVVDDEVSILQALTFLLKGWGCKVVAAQTLQDVRDNLDYFNPDIVLTDFRLKNNETGDIIISEVQNHMGFETPAIIITGTPSDHAILTATDTEYALLRKPVKAKQLRTKMIDALNL